MPHVSYDDEFQLNQIENEIFYDGNMPDKDNRWRCFEYSFYAFYKAVEASPRIQFIELIDGWTECGKWKLGDYHVVQFSGMGPLDRAFQNELTVRRQLLHYFRHHDIYEYRTRFSYPKLP